MAHVSVAEEITEPAQPFAREWVRVVLLADAEVVAVRRRPAEKAAGGAVDSAGDSSLDHVKLQSHGAMNAPMPCRTQPPPGAHRRMYSSWSDVHV